MRLSVLFRRRNLFREDRPGGILLIRMVRVTIAKVLWETLAFKIEVALEEGVILEEMDLEETVVMVDEVVMVGEVAMVQEEDLEDVISINKNYIYE